MPRSSLSRDPPTYIIVMMCFNWNTSPRGMFANKARSLGRALVPLPGEGLVLCPWTSTVEWEDVYGWLYSSDPDLVEQGVGRVAAWKARAIDNLPVAVEITADLAECQLSERRLKVSAFHSLCLSYSMAITRLGHYSLIISFSSCRLPEQDAGGRILPLHHYCVNIIKIN